VTWIKSLKDVYYIYALHFRPRSR